jgi:hypothetical protein
MQAIRTRLNRREDAGEHISLSRVFQRGLGPLLRAFSRGALSRREEDVTTFLFLALFSAFLLGMAAGALTQRFND